MKLRLALLATCLSGPALAQLPQSAQFPPQPAEAPGMQTGLTSQQAQPQAPEIPPGLPPGMMSRPGVVPDPSVIPARPQGMPTQIDLEAQAHARMLQMQQNMTAPAPAQGNVNSVPKTMPPPIPVISPDRPLTAKEKLNVAVASKWIVQAQTPHLDHNGIVHFIDGRGQIQIVTSVFHVTDLRLEPGENIMLPLSVGDMTGWQIHPVLGHEDGKPVAHITIKPEDAGLSSNLLIHTSQRTVSVELVSRQQEYMPLVALDTAEAEDDQQVQPVQLMQVSVGAQTPCDLAPSEPKEHFAISGGAWPWRPLDAYWVATPVGTKTCVTFPDGIGSGDLPVLLKMGSDGGWFSAPTREIVNVRFVNRRFMVDEALNRFVLVEGVGGNQEAITITRRIPR
jgi:type IV secretion system protein VirB9